MSNSPSGSADLASCSASLVARSVLAGVTARMRQVSRQMYVMIMSLIWSPMSVGWSPTAIFVRPGKSIRVMFSTVMMSLIVIFGILDKEQSTMRGVNSQIDG